MLSMLALLPLLTCAMEERLLILHLRLPAQVHATTAGVGGVGHSASRQSTRRKSREGDTTTVALFKLKTIGCGCTSQRGEAEADEWGMVTMGCAAVLSSSDEM